MDPRFYVMRQNGSKKTSRAPQTKGERGLWVKEAEEGNGRRGEANGEGRRTAGIIAITAAVVAAGFHQSCGVKSICIGLWNGEGRRNKFEQFGETTPNWLAILLRPNGGGID